MPRDTSIKSVLIIGSGPIIIGQACEFDYSGSQASRSLREEGIEVTLINSNPATIMTDPVTADHIYLLPLTVESIEQILQERQIDAVLPTMGGQTALNLAIEVGQRGVWEKYNVRLIGVDLEAIELAENREAFREHVVSIGRSALLYRQLFSRRERCRTEDWISLGNPPFLYTRWYWWCFCA